MTASPMTRTHLSLLVSVLVLAACSTTTGGPTLPVPSREVAIQNVTLLVPEKGLVSDEEATAPIEAVGRIHGVVNRDGTLQPYDLHYSIIRTTDLFKPELVIEVPKGSCNSGDCHAFSDVRTTVGDTDVIVQRWPDVAETVFVAHMWRRDNRILKLTWNEPSGKIDALAEAIAATVTLEKAPIDPPSSMSAPASSAPAPVSAAPSSAS